MKYQITITKTEEVPTKKGRDFAIIDTRPWEKKELEEARCYESAEKFLERNPVKEVRGYTPEYDGSKTVETEILKQTVDELDLAAVIKAINNL